MKSGGSSVAFLRLFFVHNNIFADFNKSFCPPFSKGGWDKGKSPLSCSAERESSSSALFFLIAFSFAPVFAKEKADGHISFILVADIICGFIL